MTQALNNRTNPSRWKLAFLLALGLGTLLFLPFVIFDGGYFIYYGDFNVQQIPFYKLAHEAVRSGDIWWNWHTDLGVNFIGSYSFYLLFSPFFWLTLPFPTEWVPFLMAPLLVLKTACASLTAYLYLERFVKDRAWAVVGGLLYAFSGWMLFNIFFNHFHEVAVFFPLLLLGVEQLVCENRKGFFCLMVAVNAVVNYWFFVGEAVFVVLYVLIRMWNRQSAGSVVFSGRVEQDVSLRMRPGRWPITWRKFGLIALEAVLGVGLSAAVMLPSVLAIMGNPRTGPDDLLNGWGFWLYSHGQRQPAILQSLFFPPEPPARPNFLPDHGAKWASLSAWLPLLGMTGVLAYFFGRKHDWVKKLLALSLFMALIPGLNSLFILLNNSYYARWFYMPILIMCVASIRALEDSIHTTAHFRRALGWSLAVVAVFVVMCGLTPVVKNEELSFGLAAYPSIFWVYAAITVASLALAAVVLLYLRRSKRFLVLTCFGVALVTLGFGIFYMANGKNTYEHSQAIINTAIKGRYKLELPDQPFARTDVYDGTDNLSMFWHRPTIQAFHSIVPVSIMEFYPIVGVKRDVGSRPEADYYALRPLLSVRWLFIEKTKEEQKPMPGYTFHSEQIAQNVYQNDNYLPMGYGYDFYITRSQLERVEEKFRSNIMLRALVLEDGEAWQSEDILTRMGTDAPLDFTYDSMVEDVGERRRQTALSFAPDRDGFTAVSDLERENLLFFSVPWDRGWSAWVNGRPAQIRKVNVGFMAVRVPEGPAEIRFVYRTPGLATGFWISCGSLLALACYLALVCFLGRGSRGELAGQKTAYAAQQSRMSWEEYLARHQDRQARAIHLQHVLNDASRRAFPEQLPPEQRTLDFQPESGAPQADEHWDPDA